MSLKEKIIYSALASKVIAVAVANYKEDGELFDWSCYVDAVPGQSHENEYEEVARFGDKTNVDIACSIFRGFDKSKYRR